MTNSILSCDFVKVLISRHEDVSQPALHLTVRTPKNSRAILRRRAFAVFVFARQLRARTKRARHVATGDVGRSFDSRSCESLRHIVDSIRATFVSRPGRL